MLPADLLKPASQDLASVRVIFFDAVGTLFRLRFSVGETYARVATEHGITADARKLDRAFAAAWRSMPDRPTIREPRADDDRGWWRELVNQVLAGCEIKLSTRVETRYFDALYAHFAQPGVWKLYPEVDAQLTRIATRYKLGVISNFDGRLRPILDLLEIGRHFRHVVISSEVGADKPDPWIFRAALHAANVAPEEALHVGDDPIRDWEGAAAIGMKVFPLVREEQTIADVAMALQAKGSPQIAGNYAEE